ASQFSPAPALWVDGREFAHLHRDGHLDLRLTRAAIRKHRERIDGDGRMRRRGSGDWIEVELSGRTDVPALLELVLEAIRANRRTGADHRAPDPSKLARRRRLHGAPSDDLDLRTSRRRR